ncbi:hypothetical protein QTP86_014378, partial [Hemibagrus guttatus]
HYNALYHKAKMAQELFDDHNNEFEVLTWPPNSLDLNPVGNQWDVLNKQVCTPSGILWSPCLNGGMMA